MSISSLGGSIITAPLRRSEPINPGLPDLSSTHSTTSDEDGGVSDDEEIWDMVDTLYARRLPDTKGDHGKTKLSSSLIVELDGATFGADPSTNRVPLFFPRPPDDEIDIHHFPPLTEALLRNNTGKGAKVFRTSGEF